MKKLAACESSGDAKSLIRIFWSADNDRAQWIRAHAALMGGSAMTKGFVSDELSFLADIAYQRAMMEVQNAA